MGDSVTLQLVRHQHPRDPALLPHQPGHEPLRGLRVPAGLHEDVQDLAVLVHGPPQVLPLTMDLDEDLIEMPLIPGLRPAPPQAVGKA